MKNIDKEELHTIFCKMKINKELYFNKLYEKYRKLVYSIAFSILKNEVDSEDVVQKVYTKIWNIENEKLPINNEASWLYSLTKNETLDFYKTQKKLLDIDDIYYISEENKEINEIIDKDHYNTIISKLNLQEQEIISLKILSNLSFNEISQILNIPEGTVKWKYYKSIHTLKLLLENLGMFIITFAIGLKAMLSNQRKSSNIENEIQEDTSVQDSSTTSTEQENSRESFDSVLNKVNNTILENSIQDVTIQQENVKINNYYKIAMFSISTIFFIFTIFFTIIFAKHQLKRKHKSSK